MKRPYVSGPIAGLPEVPREEKLARFARGELSLRRQGYDPINPLKVRGCRQQDCNGDAHRPDGSYNHSWSCWLKYDLIYMLEKADGIAMLPDWQSSPGATLERHVAVSLGWEVISLEDDPIVLGLPYDIEESRAGHRVPHKH